MVELIGYLGSVLVVVSMLMSSVVKLRVINTIGSGIFAGYALLIHSYPTALMNACLVGINLYNLVRLRQGDRTAFCAFCWPATGRTSTNIFRALWSSARRTGPTWSSAAATRRAFCWGPWPGRGR